MGQRDDSVSIRCPIESFRKQPKTNSTRSFIMSKQVKMNGLEMVMGNRKLGIDTLIFNMGSGTDCPSKALGFCKVASKCYAMKAERLYPGCKPYRDRQRDYWLTRDAGQIWSTLVDILESRKYQGKPLKDTVKYLRFNESGDFWSQECVRKLSQIALFLKQSYGIVTYGYTARQDLDFTGVQFVLRGSGHDNAPHGKTIVIAKNATRAPKGYNICPGDCKVCNLCKRPDTGGIAFNLH
jgi:hypothetical protein